MSLTPYEYQPPAVQAPNGWAPVPAQPQPPRPPTQLEKLAAWSQAADAAYEVARKLVLTPFVPAVFQARLINNPEKDDAEIRNKAASATAAILCGSEVGLSPMASVRAFDPIQGVAAPKAITLRAIVQSQGHDIWEVETTDTRAIIQGKRKGSDKVQESEWTIDRARGLGLLGKDQWKKQPKAMLIARATSELCRMVAADAILGIPYSVEELEDGGPLQATAEVVAPEGPKRTARRKPQPASPAPANTRPTPAETVQDRPPLPGEEEPEDAHDPEGAYQDAMSTEQREADEAITKAQLTKLAVTLKEAGVTDRERGLKLESILTGRDITSSKDLTKLEASNIIDHLERLNSDDVNAIIDGDGDQQ